MVRKFQLKPLWRTGISPITLPNQHFRTESDGKAQLEGDFFASFPLSGPSSADDRARPHIVASLRYIVPSDSKHTQQSSTDIVEGYKLELTNESTTPIFISNNHSNGTGPATASFPINKGDSVLLSVGSTIGWSSFACSTQLALSEDQLEEQGGVTESVSGHSSLQSTHSDSTTSTAAEPSKLNSNESIQRMDVDTPTEHAQPKSKEIKNDMPLLQLGAASAAAHSGSNSTTPTERNPLKEPLSIPPPDQVIRPTPDGKGVKMLKTEQGTFPNTSPNTIAPTVISPRGSSAFKDPSSLRPEIPSSSFSSAGAFWGSPNVQLPYSAIPSTMGLPSQAPIGAPTALKHSMPQNLNELAVNSGMISPRASLGIPVSSMPSALPLMSSPRGSSLTTSNGPAYGTMAMDPYLMSNHSFREMQSRHAAELETLIAKHQIEVSQLVSQHRIELDTLLRGGPLNLAATATGAAANGIGPLVGNSSATPSTLGLLHILQSLQYPGSPFSRPGTSMSNSDEIDVVSVEETPSANWKSAASVVSSTKATAAKKQAASRTPKKETSASPSGAALPPHQPSQYAQRMAATPTPASESGSEDDTSRRAQRKRKAPVQPDFFVDDREMDQILGGNGKKRRAEAPTSDSFPMPHAVNVTNSAPVTPAVSPMLPTMPYKKPKPRDNVAIATILDIYSPLKSLQPQWKFTRGAKTLILYHTDCLDHVTPDWHLESPKRLTAVMESIQMVQDRYGEYAEVINTFTPADMSIVRQCHEEAYIKKITSKIPLNRAMPPLHATQDIDLSLSMSMSLMKSSSDPDAACEPPKDTYVSFGSWNAALLAAGSVIEAVDRLMARPTKLRNAFCGVRPPGHHAGSHGHDGASTNGYCVLNSVAIGAQHAFNKYNLKRIAILDFDVHQGNGTAQIVEKDPRILFISLHASEIYPFSESTKADADKCTDRIINIGYPTGTNGKQFMELFLNRCKQLLVDFSPELILLSSGFDAHIDDPTGAGMLRFADYVALTRVVKEIADSPTCRGRIISVLEGGYDIRALKLSVTAHLLALMEGPSCPPAPGEPVEPEPAPAESSTSTAAESSLMQTS